MTFRNLTRGEEHAGFQVLGRLGVNENHWRRMTNSEDLAQRVAKQFLQNETASGEPVKPKSVLRLITSGLALSATKGRRLLSKQKALFPGWIDHNLFNYGCDVASESKPETLVDVYEQVKNATFREMFGGQGVELDKLCLTQDQIISFVENHRGHLHPNGWANFFLFKVPMKNAEGEMEDHFFVARVRWGGGDRGLEVVVCRFSYGLVWDAGRRRRVVLPRLSP